MISDTDFDRLADDWMAIGPQDLSDHVLGLTLDEVRQTRQRRPSLPRRIVMALNPPRTTILVLGAALIGMVAFAGLAGSQRRDEALLLPPASTAPASPAVPDPTTPPASLAPLGYDGGGLITFKRTVDGSSALWLINPDGSGERQLQPPFPFGDPDRFSLGGCCVLMAPDGTQVAAAFDTADEDYPTAVVIAEPSSGAFISQVPDCGGCASVYRSIVLPGAWAPDSQHLALQVIGPDGAGRSGISIAGTANGSRGVYERQITGIHEDIPLAYSPDGRQLLFVRADGSADGARGPLFVVDVRTKAVRQVTPDGVLVRATEYTGGGASWSPDGTRIAWAGTDAFGDTGQTRVFVANADGTDATALSDAAPSITSARWSPDGRWIAYDRPDATGRLHDLFVVSPDGATTRNLTDGFDPGVCCAAWDPTGSALLVAGTPTRNDRSQLLIVPIDGSGVRQVTRVEGSYESFGWGVVP